jgi:hypothetical protein
VLTGKIPDNSQAKSLTEKIMDSEQQEAFIDLQTRSCGLGEAFRTAGRNLVLTEDDADYARDACVEILYAIELIQNGTD